MNILIAEGSPTIAGGITNYLEALGAGRHECVFSSDEALERLEEQALRGETPDLIIVGWKLAESSGTEFTRRIRAHPDLRRLPILMVSPHDDRRRVLQAYQADVNGYLLRPFDRKGLAAKIDELTSRARSLSPEAS